MLRDFNRRSLKKELLDENHLDKDQVNQNLTEFIYLNRYLGVKSTLLKALNKIVRFYKQDFKNNTLSIADLGCGAGDLLIEIYHWAKENTFKTKLTGIDCNPFIVDFAKAKAQSYTNISIQKGDIFLPEIYNENFDIICLNNICHHFTDEQMIQLLKLLSSQTLYAIIINDLRRHPIAYYAIKWISKLFNLSSYAQHDGPLSVLKAFNRKELEQYLLLSNIQNFEINKRFPFRWQVIVWLK